MGELPIAVHRCDPAKAKPIPTDPKLLGFGRHFSDHLFRAQYVDGQWGDARVQPHGALNLDPACMALHYGLECFEGLKAYRGADDAIYTFRWKKNAQRLINSAKRLMMEAPPVELFGQALKALVRVDKAWVPRAEGCTLYIRPTLIGSDPFLGVRPAKVFDFFIVCSPVGAYYASGFKPTRIFVSEEDVRACKGGLGEAKTGANYAASLRAQSKAQAKGYTQVLWLDALEHKYCEEVGTSNVFFKIKGKVITPPLAGTILPGVTRDSVIQILKSWDQPIAEEPISIDEVVRAAENGDLEEAFGTGTAAVISPIGVLGHKGKDYTVNNEQVGPLAQKLYAYLTDLQYGRSEDPFGWRERIE